MSALFFVRYTLDIFLICFSFLQSANVYSIEEVFYSLYNAGGGFLVKVSKSSPFYYWNVSDSLHLIN